MTAYIAELERRRACKPAIEWLKAMQYPTAEAAWLACHRGDWLLWAYLELGCVSGKDPGVLQVVTEIMDAAGLPQDKNRGVLSARCHMYLVLLYLRDGQPDIAIARVADYVADRDRDPAAGDHALRKSADIVRAHFSCPWSTP